MRVSRTAGWVRRLVALVALTAMVGLFVCPTAACFEAFGWLPRIQLVPAVAAGSVLVLVGIAVSVALCGRLYCSVACPLGLAQDLVRFCFGWFLPRKAARPLARWVVMVRFSLLVLFAVGAVFGFTGLLAPYGIFGRFMSLCVSRVGKPAVGVTLWAALLFAFVMATSLVRARWWCNRVCPVGTFLGLFSRFAVFRVRIDAAKCVKCGLCAKRCDKGALAVRDDRSIAVDSASCVACFDCVGSCRKEALTWR